MQPIAARALEFNEADHPRGTGDQGGQFVEKGTGGSGSTTTRQHYQPPTSRPDRFTRGSSRAGGKAKPAKAYLPPGTLQRGADNDPEAVKQLQAMLGELGLGQIAVDGLFGPETENAVKAAQEKLGLKPTGTASPALQRKLHDAHTLSPCIDRAQSKVTAAAAVRAAGEGDEPEHTGAMVALIPTDDDAKRLAVDDGEPVDELHCTLLYLGEAADLDDEARSTITAAVGDVAAQHGPVEADGFAADVDAAPDQHAPWIPHVTLIYDADPSMVADLTDRTGPVTFDRLRVAFGDEVHDYPLRGGRVAAAAGHDVTPGHDELHHYWTRGKGLAKWAESPTPWTTLYHHLLKYAPTPEAAKRWASKWFEEVFGFTAGSDLNRVTHGKPPRGKLVGPG